MSFKNLIINDAKIWYGFLIRGFVVFGMSLFGSALTTNSLNCYTSFVIAGIYMFGELFKKYAIDVNVLTKKEMENKYKFLIFP